MATILNDEEENNQAPGTGNPAVGTSGNTSPQGPVAPVGGGAVRLSPSSGTGSAAGGGGARGGSSATAGTEGGTGAGGQFATLNDYVNANAPAAQNLANDVLQPITNQYNTLSNENTSTESGINSAITGGYTPYQDLSSQVTPTNIVSFASDPNNVSTFQNQANDQYTGPTSAEGNTAYQTQLTNDQTAISNGKNLTGSTEGQNQLLQNIETSVPNNPGVTSLNEAILTANPNYESQIENAYQPFQGLVSGLQSYAPTADQAIATGQNQASEASNAANNEIASNINNLNTAVNATASTDQSNQNQYNNSLAAYQNTWNPIETDVKALNQAIPQYLGAGSYTLSDPLTTYLNEQPNNNTYTTANIATPEQYQQANAYSQLVNGLTTAAPSIVLNQGTANQAGTAAAAPTAFTPPGSTNDIAQQLWNEQNTAAAPSSWTNSYNSVEGGNNPTWNQIDPFFATLMQALEQIDPAVNPGSHK